MPIKVLLAGKDIIITIDGPAGTGKSSVSRQLAQRLGLQFLDTGSMYRAAAAVLLDHGININSHAEVLREVIAADIRFDWSKDPPAIEAFGVSLGDRIRDKDVSSVVSPLSAVKEIREHMVALQRQFGREHPRLVTEGRDQGSVVFPHAALKFFLTADASVRAARRAKELRDKGFLIDEAQVLQELIERDTRDASRADGPLICPKDALVIDTSAMSFSQVVQRLEDQVRAKFE